MNLNKILNRKVSFTKTTFYILVLVGCLIGVVSGIYSENILRYFGLDFLADNSLAIGMGLLFVGSTGMLFNIINSSQKNINISDNALFNKQISDLEKATSSIKSLEDFIAHQKNALLENKQILEKLNQEREKLGPVVESDRKLVDSILSLQSEKRARSILKERVIGFLIGLISSSLASIIIWYFTT